jgi:ribosome-associated heat shock protein Hsp15
LRWTVIVRGLNHQRRPAPEARLLYEETPESAARRQRLEEIRRLAPVPGAGLRGRPTKKAGRLIRGFNE